ncbi:MAG: hypothetical protein K0V04_07675 [Deltaproteobacteria bacterium]|nr:hypothetical protein [Deltaproteobacteria bacterium]
MNTHRHPRLGCAVASRRTPPGVRVFGVVSTDGTAGGLFPLSQRVFSWTTENHPSEHLWMVGSAVEERLQFSAVPVGPPELSEPNVLRRSVMRLRIRTTDTAGGSVYEVDLGQSLEVYAQALQVDLLAPRDSVTVVGGPVAPQAGLVFASRCSLRMLALDVTRGARSALLTQTVFVPAGQPTVLEVPTAAARLTAYAETLAAPPVWRWLRGEPAPGTAVPLGQVAWTIDAPRLEVDVPSATHLRIEPAAGARTFTLVWTIAP